MATLNSVASMRPIVSVVTLQGWQICSRKIDQLALADNGTVHG